LILITLADAHLVCKRAKNHYDPRSDSDTTSSAGGGGGLQDLRERYRPLHDNQAGNMYFMVRVIDYYLQNGED
jgi:eukaryotic translation initiation factor 2C